MGIRLISWNVNGIRAAIKKGFNEFLAKESPDILCLQETKASTDQLKPEEVTPEGYYSYWNSAERKGYSGVALFSKVEPKSVSYKFAQDKFNNEGRIIIADFEDFVVFNLYVPNGQKDDERLQYKMDFSEQLIEELKQYSGRKVVVCGDYNTAHNEIDLKNPKSNSKNSGFLPMEREWIDRYIEFGYTDTFRHLYPEQVTYSWWSYRFKCREKNIGWRIDYNFVSPELLPDVKDAFIMTDVLGSDHCPVGVLF
jgi:exodeoxyribonuclease-3